MKFGKAFPEELQKVSSFKFKKSPRRKLDQDWQDGLFMGSSISEETHLMSSWRKLNFMIPIFIVFAIIFVRLFHLQVVHGNENRDLADTNRIHVKVIHAPRGVIYDRNGKILAQNEPGFRLTESTTSAQKARVIDRDQALKMEIDGDPNFKNLEIDNIRAYPLGEKTAHILGYVSEITSEELESPEYKNYRLGDKVGRGGIEEAYEKVLKGVDGGEIIEVDAAGKKIRTMRRTEPVPGQNIYLTIDSQLQEIAFEKLVEGVTKAKSCCGAAVAQDPNTGQILALVSYPSFDPKDIGRAVVAENSPILNRVIAGVYPPGSTYKIASALAGLDSGKITEKTLIEDTGIMNLGTFTFANWYFTQYGRKEGLVDVVKALQRSNDIYFYQLGYTIGEEKMGETSRKLGLGKKTGIDIPGESAGLIPDNNWKVKNIGEQWYPGDTLHMSIGQGYVLSTPLQILNITSFVAANGKQYPPHLALKITEPTGHTIKEYRYDHIDSYKFKDEHLNLIKKGLEAVPVDGGTAWPFFTFPIKTAGKTGTAEFGDPKGNTHAWYTAYGPLDHPTISLTVLVEAGGEGSSTTGPIAKEIFRHYFSSDKKNLIKDGTLEFTSSARTLGE